MSVTASPLAPPAGEYQTVTLSYTGLTDSTQYVVIDVYPDGSTRTHPFTSSNTGTHTHTYVVGANGTYTTNLYLALQPVVVSIAYNSGGN